MRAVSWRVGIIFTQELIGGSNKLRTSTPVPLAQAFISPWIYELEWGPSRVSTRLGLFL